MKKTLKVKSRVRFTAFVLIMLFAVTGLFNTMLGLNDALGLTKQEYIEVNINSGDTLSDHSRTIYAVRYGYTQSSSYYKECQ